MKKLILTVAATVCLSTMALAASYDGSWVGQDQPEKCGVRAMTMTVTGGNKASILVVVGLFAGKIDAVGAGTIQNMRIGRSFPRDKFSVSGDGICGRVNGTHL